MVQDIGVGIIGYGFIGRVHTLSYLDIPIYYRKIPFRPHLVAVSDAQEAAREAALSEARFETAYADYGDLLARDDIQVVNVCTPNVSHKEVIIAALRAGKHVYAEKPLAMSVAEAEEIAAVASETKCITQLALEFRWIPATLRAEQLIQEGFLGKVYHFRSSYLHSGYIDPSRPISWRLMRAYSGGGAMFDLASHILDLIYFLLGPYARVSAQVRTMIPERPLAGGQPGETAKVDVDDYVCLQADMARGGYGIVEASRLATGSQNELRFEIHGSKGGLRFNSMQPNWLEAYDVTSTGDPIGGRRGWTQIETVQRYQESDFPGPKFEIGWTRYCLHSQFAFLKAVHEGRQTIPSVFDGLHIHKVMDAGYRSSTEHGRWLDIDSGGIAPQ